MGVAEIILAALNAIAAIPKIGAMVEGWVGIAVTWWMGRQKSITMTMIIDAASAQARSQTPAEMIKANAMWRDAVSRKRAV